MGTSGNVTLLSSIKIRLMNIDHQMAPAIMVMSLCGYETTYIDGLVWAAAQGRAPFVVVGYGTTKALQKVYPKYVIKFHCGPKGYAVPNNIQPADNDPVKHTRVARANVKEWDSGVLTKFEMAVPTSPKELKKLMGHLKCYCLAYQHEANDRLQNQMLNKGGLSRTITAPVNVVPVDSVLYPITLPYLSTPNSSSHLTLLIPLKRLPSDSSNQPAYSPTPYDQHCAIPFPARA